MFTILARFLPGSCVSPAKISDPGHLNVNGEPARAGLQDSAAAKTTYVPSRDRNPGAGGGRGRAVIDRYGGGARAAAFFGRPEGTVLKKIVGCSGDSSGRTRKKPVPRS